MRLVKTLQQMAEVFGEQRQASVSREISKLHNTTHNGTLAALAAHFQANAPRGEIVLVVEGEQAPIPVKVDKYAKFKQKHIQQLNNIEE